MLLVNMALGLIAKAVPQINIFIESFPIRIALGLLIMALTLRIAGRPSLRMKWLDWTSISDVCCNSCSDSHRGKSGVGLPSR